MQQLLGYFTVIIVAAAPIAAIAFLRYRSNRERRERRRTRADLTGIVRSDRSK
ncbi:MAG: hypothetical protein WC729_21990 [Sphingomonas sp.]|uniref:hypothetical protein n=1 Tax=Sphingomonas sp. TaxID=28214 RepID=UPI0035652540